LVTYTGWLNTYEIRTKHAKYVFTKSQRKQYVDARDKKVFMDEIYDGVKVFE